MPNKCGAKAGTGFKALANVSANQIWIEPFQGDVQKPPN